jgi:hypothetical protein
MGGGGYIDVMGILGTGDWGHFSEDGLDWTGLEFKAAEYGYEYG